MPTLRSRISLNTIDWGERVEMPPLSERRHWLCEHCKAQCGLYTAAAVVRRASLQEDDTVSRTGIWRFIRDLYKLVKTNVLHGYCKLYFASFDSKNVESMKRTFSAKRRISLRCAGAKKKKIADNICRIS